jgi:hypothetical protein
VASRGIAVVRYDKRTLSHGHVAEYVIGDIATWITGDILQTRSDATSPRR